MFRFYCYYDKNGTPLRLNSEAFTSQAECQAVLDILLDTPQFTGGGVEQRTDRFGWVLADDIESAMIAARRAEIDALIL